MPNKFALGDRVRVACAPRIYTVKNVSTWAMVVGSMGENLRPCYFVVPCGADASAGKWIDEAHLSLAPGTENEKAR